jgi:hypothetical protein
VAADYLQAAAAVGAAARAAATAAAARLLRCDADADADANADATSFSIGVFNPLGWRVADAVASLPLPRRPRGVSPTAPLLLRDARSAQPLPCQLDAPDGAQEAAAWEAAAAAEGDGSHLEDAEPQLMMRFRVSAPPLGMLAVDAVWLADGDDDAAATAEERRAACAAPRAFPASALRANIGGDVTLRPRHGGFHSGAGVTLHDAFADVAVNIQARRYIYLPDDDLFGSGPYVTRSLLVSGLYLWIGLAAGGAAGAVAVGAAAAMRRRRRRRQRGASGSASAAVQKACSSSGNGGAQRRFAVRAFVAGACFGASAVACLLQSRILLSDAAARALMKHGLSFGAHIGAAASLSVAALSPAGGGAFAAAAFLAGGAAGVPSWLFAAPARHARRLPPAHEAQGVPTCLQGAVSAACTVLLGQNAWLTVTAPASASAAASPLTLRVRAAAEDDSEVVVRIAPVSRSGADAATRDDGVRALPFTFSAARSVPANAAPIAGFVTLPSSSSALLALRPTGGTRLGGGAELSVARSVTSDDGRGLGRGAHGRDSSEASLTLLLLPHAPPAALRAAQRAALHAPLAVRLPRRCAAAAAAPRLTSALPADIHIALLRSARSDDDAHDDGGNASASFSRLTLHHLGEPGVDAPHALDALAAALGGEARVTPRMTRHGGGADDENHASAANEAGWLWPGELAQLTWRPAWGVTPRGGGDDAAAARCEAGTAADAAACVV